jgi:hypothetical protein
MCVYYDSFIVLIRYIGLMQTVEKVNKPFLVKLLLLFVLLFLGFISKVPPFTQEYKTAITEQTVSNEDKIDFKQIQQLYYQMVSGNQSETVAI